MTAAGNLVYCSGGVVDVTDPQTPILVGGTNYWAGWDIDIVGDLVYVSGSVSIASDVGDVAIMPTQCSSVVSIEGDPAEPEGSDEILGAALHLSVHPNPFNPQTTVSFTLSQSAWTNVGVYDLTGRQVTELASREFSAGHHTLTWTGRDSAGRAVPSGTYIVWLETEERVESKKVMLVR
jgi:hypothetical protein